MHLIVGAFAVLCGGRTEALGRSQAVRMASAARAGPDGAAVSAADVLRVAEQAGRAAAEVVRNRLGAEVLKTKATRGDLLTEVDGEVERLIQQAVAEAFPTHGFLGEESVEAGAKASAAALDAAMDASGSDWLWICDPIDGTTNFVQGDAEM